MQVLIVCCISNDTHRQCSWQTDRVTKRDTDAVSNYVREIMRDAERDDAQVTEVFVFVGGDCTRHEGKADIMALIGAHT